MGLLPWAAQECASAGVLGAAQPQLDEFGRELGNDGRGLGFRVGWGGGGCRMALNDFGLGGECGLLFKGSGGAKSSTGFIWIERLIYTLKKCGPFRERPEKAECPLV